MAMILRRPVRASRLSLDLGLELAGADLEIKELCGLDSLTAHGLSFVRDRRPPAVGGGAVFAACPEPSGKLTVLVSSNPRLDFIRAQHLLAEKPGVAEDETPARIHPTARIGRYAVVENGVSIGEGTRVGSLAVIRSGTIVGAHCEIKAGAVIGESGFGFERDAQNHPLNMIHCGGVRVGDHVEIGSMTTISRGALGNTVLADHVKIDDHCHISHNCVIGEGAIITSCVEISGSVVIGRNAWLSPGCALVQKITIGEGAFVGIGSVVTRCVGPGARVFGNPARLLPAMPGPIVNKD